LFGPALELQHNVVDAVDVISLQLNRSAEHASDGGETKCREVLCAGCLGAV